MNGQCPDSSWNVMAKDGKYLSPTLFGSQQSRPALPAGDPQPEHTVGVEGAPC